MFTNRALDDIDYFIEQTISKIENTKNIIENFICHEIRISSMIIIYKI